MTCHPMHAETVFSNCIIGRPFELAWRYILCNAWVWISISFFMIKTVTNKFKPCLMSAMFILHISYTCS
jgi:hypothetical protein